MVERKSCKDFQDTGLLLIINQLLHVFGWAIVICIDKDTELSFMYPARVKFRGFDNDSVSKAYKNVSQYIHDNSKDLLDESKTS